MIWYVSVMIILITILLIILLRYNDVPIHPDYKYLAGAIGISGFMFAILAEGLFVEPENYSEL